MKLKPRVKSLDDIDEKYHDLYVKKGDEFVLDVEEKQDDRLSEFRQNNIELKKANDELKKQLADLQKIVEPFKDMKPDEIQKAKDALAEQAKNRDKKLIEEGKVDEVVAARTATMKEDYDRRLTQAQKTIETLTAANTNHSAKLKKLTIRSTVMNAIDAVGAIRQGAADDVLSRAEAVWDLDEHGNLKGKDLYNSSGKDMTMEEWAKDLLQKAPHLFESSQGGGAGGSGKPKDKEPNVKSVDGSDPLAVGKNLEGIAKGTTRVNMPAITE